MRRESLDRDFGEVLRVRREDLDLTQKQLAARAGISDAYICCLERGSKQPPSERICRQLEEALQLPEGTLVTVARRQRTDPDILLEMDLVKMKRDFERKLDARIAEVYRHYWESMLRHVFEAGEGGEASADLATIRRRFREAMAAEVSMSMASVPRAHRHEFESLGEEIVQRWSERYEDLAGTLSGAVSGQSGGRVTLDDQADEALSNATMSLDRERPIPVINKVAAGYPRMETDLDLPVGFAESYVYDPTVKAPGAFAVTVCGDSMEPRFHEGDIVVVDPEAEVHGGAFCFVRFAADGDTTFKQVYFDTPETIRLQPLNSQYPPQVHPREAVDAVLKVVRRIERL